VNLLTRQRPHAQPLGGARSFTPPDAPMAAPLAAAADAAAARLAAAATAVTQRLASLTGRPPPAPTPGGCGLTGPGGRRRRRPAGSAAGGSAASALAFVAVALAALLQPAVGQDAAANNIVYAFPAFRPTSTLLLRVGNGSRAVSATE
jgi:hypothetical protein